MQYPQLKMDFGTKDVVSQWGVALLPRTALLLPPCWSLLVLMPPN